MRVAMFGESYLPYLSGVTVATRALASGLAQLGHEVLLVVPAPADGPPAAGEQLPGLEIAWLPAYHAPPAPPGYRMPVPVPSAALRRAAAFEPDIVHAHSPFVSGVMARAVARSRGVPLVFTHHTRFADYAHYLGPLAGPARLVTGAWLRSWWKGCAAVIAPGSALAADIRQALGAHRRPLVRVIPSGVDVDAIRALPEGHPRRASGWLTELPLVVSLGRVAPEKSVDVLVAAFAVAARRRPRLRLLLVGGGPGEDAVRSQAAALGLGDRIRVTGRTPHVEALAFLKAADVFLFASQTETQGLVLAEALAAGVPVVALDGPGVADTVRDGVDGVVIPGEPAATRAHRLGRALGQLLSDGPRRDRMAAAAAGDADRLSSGARVRQVAALYEEVLAPGG